MTSTHELGHLVAGWSCGGTLRSANLRPWHLPYSIFDPDPRPLVTRWGGPALGVALPRGAALLVRRHWVWFITYVCILANGVYLATAWVFGDRYLDTPQLLECGANPAVIAIYCLLTTGFGYVGFRRHCVRMLSSTANTTAAQSRGNINT
ncbi:MAG: hypothetical protein A2W31_00445 [Planctomycetes bacterium RBG_16_64_10]|nr:MAG: hypothetical protein A2W31_00445 [Planctomycetes bacterium RBG_16_64_10]